MQKVVIAGSASLEAEIGKWVAYWRAKEGFLVLNYPRAIPRDTFDTSYPDVHTRFFRDITETDVLFIANENKRGTEGYIGAETFAELAFGLAQRLVHGKNLQLLLAHEPSREVACYEEIDLWRRLGWIEIMDIVSP